MNPLITTSALLLDVTLNRQQHTEKGVPFALYAPIRLSALTPFSGSNLGEDLVYGTGNHFVAGPGLVMVFGTHSVPATVVSEGILVARSPSVATVVTVDVYVSNNGGIDR